MEMTPAVKKKSRFRQVLKNLNNNKVFLLMLMPGSILLLIFSYLPMPGIIIAFKKMRFYSPSIITNIVDSKWMGLKNFEFLFNTPDAWRITRNTVGYNLIFIITVTILSVLFAVMLNEVKNKGLSKLYQTTMMLPYFLSWVVVSYIVYAFFNETYGIVNKVILPALGKDAVMWYTNLKAWPAILIFLNAWKNIGYSAVVYIAAMSGIDQELYEAASIDGASKLQQIRCITLPHLTPLITILTILAVGRIFQGDFGLFYFATMNQGGGVLKAVTDVINTYTYDVLNNGNIGMAAAASLYQSVVGFVLVLAANFVVSKIDEENSLF